MTLLLGVLMWVTAYAPGCGSSGLTAAGTAPHSGTVAAPPAYAFGTRLLVEGVPWSLTVEDRGPAIWGNRLDIWLPDCASARAWGRRMVWVWAMPSDERPDDIVELD